MFWNVKYAVKVYSAEKKPVVFSNGFFRGSKIALGKDALYAIPW
jgi:hypothetical protein